jgi:hypothetical protein
MTDLNVFDASANPHGLDARATLANHFVYVPV